MTILPIWADFNAIGYGDPQPHNVLVHLTKRGTFEDLARNGIKLEEGLTLYLYDNDADAHGNEDNLVAKAVAHYDQERGEWVAIIDGQDMGHVSDFAEDPHHWASAVDWAAIHE